MREMTMPLLVNVVPGAQADADQPDIRVTEEVLILKAARARDEAKRRADACDFDGGTEALRLAAEDLRAAAEHSERKDELLAQADKLDAWHNHLSPASWDALSSKAMHYESWRSRRGRR